MEIIIHQAILHVLDTTMDAPVLSGSGMEMTAEKTAYSSTTSKSCLPATISASAARCRIPPLKTSWSTTTILWTLLPHRGRLFDYMHAHTTIPGADLAVVDFTAMVSRGWAS